MQSTDTATSDTTYAESVREHYDTTDLGAIMGRFYNAVSWRNE
jgi:hypothetical protein